MLKHGSHRGASGTTEAPESRVLPARRPASPEPGGRRPRRHAAGLRRRPERSLRRHVHLDAAGLHLRPQPALRAGSHRDRAVHRHRGVRAVRRQRLRRLPVLLRAVQPDPQRARRRWRRAARPRAAARPRSIRNWPPSTPPPRPSSSTRRPTGRRAGLRPLQPDRQRRQLPGGDDELGCVRGGHAAGDRQTENGIFQRMAAQGQTVIAASGDAGSEDCFPTDRSDRARRRRSRVAARRRQRRRHDHAQRVGLVADGLERLPGHAARCSGNSQLGATGGGYSIEWPANPGQPTASGPTPPPAGWAPAGRSPTSPIRRTPRPAGWPPIWDGHWTGFGGTSVAAPTNAGLFVDTNQGCFSPLGRVGPALYAAQQANGDTFTDITQGNNDFTGTNLGRFAAATGFDAASGLGTPVDQNLALALQGADGCPSVAAVSPEHGSGQRRRAPSRSSGAASPTPRR